VGKKKIWYEIVEQDGEPYESSRYFIESHYHSRYASDLQMFAEKCAESYEPYSFDMEWPLTFALYFEIDGEEIGRFVVEREMVPEFTAREQKIVTCPNCQSKKTRYLKYDPKVEWAPIWECLDCGNQFPYKKEGKNGY
jgi:ribosomal protein L37AE/L43A